ncbi:hypothetical protein ACFXGR_42285 [Streptomyces mirabilis]|uniref:hypothetical protein n=1 Tax=Streptomyces mirabilis TaxID=68239 RepID=UPI0036CD68ED
MRVLTEGGAPACPHCRSDTALGILEGLFRRRAAAVRSSSPRGLLGRQLLRRSLLGRSLLLRLGALAAGPLGLGHQAAFATSFGS